MKPAPPVMIVFISLGSTWNDVLVLVEDVGLVEWMAKSRNEPSTKKMKRLNPLGRSPSRMVVKGSSRPRTMS